MATDKKAAPAKKRAKKTATETAGDREGAQASVEMVKFEVTAPVAEIGQMELYRGWRGELPMDKAQSLVKLEMGKITGV